MKILFLIPARAGSKGLPHKNIKPLQGKPLFMYSVDFAKQCMQAGDELCISTDDDSLIEMASAHNIDIPFKRPEYLSTDTASSYDVMIHALSFYEQKGIPIDALCLLQPTSPFREKEDFNKIKEEFDDSCEMAVSVSVAKENPYFNLFEEDADGYLKQSKEGTFSRRQDAPTVYAYNGSIYLIRIDALKKRKLNEFKKIKKVVMPRERSVDIDVMSDWILAEYYLNNKNNENGKDHS